MYDRAQYANDVPTFGAGGRLRRAPASVLLSLVRMEGMRQLGAAFYTER